MDLRRTPHAGLYKLLYIDPPTAFETHSEKGLGKSPEQHYETLKVQELIDLAIPVDAVAAQDCWLALWTTFPLLLAPVGPRELVASWNDPDNPWTYVSGGAWGKRPRNWRGNPGTWQFGTGYTFRNAGEILLLFKRGAPKWRSRRERGFWDAPIRAHSQKPDEVRDALTRACDGPRLEMFGRTTHDGWDCWGMETGKLDGR